MIGLPRRGALKKLLDVGACQTHILVCPRKYGMNWLWNAFVRILILLRQPELEQVAIGESKKRIFPGEATTEPRASELLAKTHQRTSNCRNVSFVRSGMIKNRSWWLNFTDRESKSEGQRKREIEREIKSEFRSSEKSVGSTN
jgi:hypothetical protein